MDQEKIGKFIQDARRKKNLTQYDLANMLDVTDKAVSKWERGLSFPDISLLEPLSKALDVSVLEILHGENQIDSQCLKKKDMKVLLETELEIAKEQKKNNNFLHIIIIFLLVIISIFIIKNSEIIFCTFFQEGYSEVFRFDNFGIIPFDEIFNLVYFQGTVSIQFLIRSVIINIIISILTSLLLLQLVKNKRKYFVITIVLNILLEFVKWMFAVMNFDSDDIIIRILVGIVVYYIYKKINERR